MKDWSGAVGAVTGTFALIISGITLYYSVLLQEDDLRLVVGEPPYVALSEKDLRAEGYQSLVFINAGNRSTGVANVDLYFLKPLELSTCDSKNRQSIHMILESFGIKAGEIVDKKLSYDSWWKKQRQFEPFDVFVARNFPMLKEGDELLVCLALSVVTPDNYREKRLPLFKYKVTQADMLIGAGKPQFGWLFDQTKQIVLNAHQQLVILRQ